MRKFFLFIIASLCILLLPWAIISWQTRGLIYYDVQSIPPNEVGLLLGTTPSIGGRENLFFSTRIEATKELYERGKIHYILVSGDNGDAAYNEPEYMKKALIKSGIPDTVITLDYAGFRTLDSVIRAKEVFSLTGGVTIISQPFHLERAIFLAQKRWIPAIGYAAANVSFQYGFPTYIREIAARWLALYDAWFGTDATVLGSKLSVSGEATQN